MFIFVIIDGYLVLVFWHWYKLNNNDHITINMTKWQTIMLTNSNDN